MLEVNVPVVTDLEAKLCQYADNLLSDRLHQRGCKSIRYAKKRKTGENQRKFSIQKKSYGILKFYQRVKEFWISKGKAKIHFDGIYIFFS